MFFNDLSEEIQGSQPDPEKLQKLSNYLWDKNADKFVSERDFKKAADKFGLNIDWEDVIDQQGSFTESSHRIFLTSKGREIDLPDNIAADTFSIKEISKDPKFLIGNLGMGEDSVRRILDGSNYDLLMIERKDGFKHYALVNTEGNGKQSFTTFSTDKVNMVNTHLHVDDLFKKRGLNLFQKAFQFFGFWQLTKAPNFDVDVVDQAGHGNCGVLSVISSLDKTHDWQPEISYDGNGRYKVYLRGGNQSHGQDIYPSDDLKGVYVEIKRSEIYSSNYADNDLDVNLVNAAVEKYMNADLDRRFYEDTTLNGISVVDGAEIAQLITGRKADYESIASSPADEMNDSQFNAFKERVINQKVIYAGIDLEPIYGEYYKDGQRFPHITAWGGDFGPYDAQALVDSHAYAVLDYSSDRGFLIANPWDDEHPFWVDEELMRTITHRYTYFDESEN